jgi:cytochrome oxidase Cu insertion factor (SCO1/SenC/PrrC family)
MAIMIDMIKKKCGDVITPVFITADPARDSPAVIKEYLEEFHPDIVGLTGEYENIKSCCKYYRVYFSTPPKLQPGQDYLVDHSIYFYLMGRSFRFIYGSMDRASFPILPIAPSLSPILPFHLDRHSPPSLPPPPSIGY